MKRPKTYLAIVLDSSGSMATTKLQTVQGFNEQVQQAKANSKDQDIICCLVTFNGEVFEHQWLVPAAELQEASADDYKPMGSTAMRDAVGYTIAKLLATTNPDEENVAYLVYVVSDGEENASKHYSVGALKELIDSVERRPNFNITYMGCSPTYIKEVAAQTGIPIANMAAWNNADAGTALGGWQASNKAIERKFYRARAKGLQKCNMVQSDQSGVLADYSDEVGVVDNSTTDPNVANAAVNHVVNMPQHMTNVFGSNAPVTWSSNG